MALSHPEKVLSICGIATGPIGATSETNKPLTEEEQKIAKKTWEIFLSRKDSTDPEKHVEGFLAVYEYLNGKIPLDKELAKTYITTMINNSQEEYLRPGNPHERVMQALGESVNSRIGILKKIQAPTLFIQGEVILFACHGLSLQQHKRFLMQNISKSQVWDICF